MLATVMFVWTASDVIGALVATIILAFLCVYWVAVLCEKVRDWWRGTL